MELPYPNHAEISLTHTLAKSKILELEKSIQTKQNNIRRLENLFRERSAKLHKLELLEMNTNLLHAYYVEKCKEPSCPDGITTDNSLNNNSPDNTEPNLYTKTKELRENRNQLEADIAKIQIGIQGKIRNNK